MVFYYYFVFVSHNVSVDEGCAVSATFRPRIVSAIFIEDITAFYLSIFMILPALISSLLLITSQK